MSKIAAGRLSAPKAYLLSAIAACIAGCAVPPTPAPPPVAAYAVETKEQLLAASVVQSAALIPAHVEEAAAKSAKGGADAARGELTRLRKARAAAAAKDDIARLEAEIALLERRLAELEQRIVEEERTAARPDPSGAAYSGSGAVYTGPRGGKYTISPSGNKQYIRKK